MIRRIYSAVPIWRAADGAAKIGSPPVLLTHALADFLRAHRLTYRRLGLPICARAPMRLKRGLGIDKLGERRARWAAAQADRRGARRWRGCLASAMSRRGGCADGAAADAALGPRFFR